MKLKDKFTELMYNQALKRKLYVIIFEADTPAGKLFDVTLIWCILLSVGLVILESLQGLPVWLKTPFIVMEYLLTAFFTFEYITRLYCSPQTFQIRFQCFRYHRLAGYTAALSRFPVSRGTLSAYYTAFRLIRIFRVFKLFNFWMEGQMLLTALRDSSKKIAVFFMFVVILVISIGTLMYMVEGGKPNTQFSNIPNSIYWACVTLTTVGYGDITPVTALGKFLSGCVMLIGYTIIAVPTGIVSVSLMKRHERM